MWQWISSLDVNAVFLAVVAALGYLHNHSFRKSLAAAPAASSSPAGQPAAADVAKVGVVLCVLIATMIAWSACGGRQERQTIIRAEEACLAGTAAQLAIKLAAAKASGESANAATVALELLPFEIECAIAAARVQATAAAGSGA